MRRLNLRQLLHRVASIFRLIIPENGKFPDFGLKNVKKSHISIYQQYSVSVFQEMGGAIFFEKKPK